MQTVIKLGDSNCPWCLNAMVEHLRVRPRVREVQINASAGCLVVNHDHDDVAELLADIGEVLRGSVEMSNGEVVMIALRPSIVLECPSAGHHAHQ